MMVCSKKKGRSNCECHARTVKGAGKEKKKEAAGSRVILRNWLAELLYNNYTPFIVVLLDYTLSYFPLSRSHLGSTTSNNTVRGTRTLRVI